VPRIRLREPRVLRSRWFSAGAHAPQEAGVYPLVVVQPGSGGVVSNTFYLIVGGS